MKGIAWVGLISDVIWAKARITCIAQHSGPKARIPTSQRTTLKSVPVALVRHSLRKLQLWNGKYQYIHYALYIYTFILMLLYNPCILLLIVFLEEMQGRTRLAEELYVCQVGMQEKERERLCPLWFLKGKCDGRPGQFSAQLCRKETASIQPSCGCWCAAGTRHINPSVTIQWVSHTIYILTKWMTGMAWNTVVCEKKQYKQKKKCH